MEITVSTQYSLFPPAKYDEPNISCDELAEKYSEYFSQYGYIPSYPDLAKEKNKVKFGSFRLNLNLEEAAKAESDYIKALNNLSNQGYRKAKQRLNSIMAYCPRYIAAINTLAKIELLETNLDIALDYCIDGLNVYDHNLELLNIMALIFEAKGMPEAAIDIKRTITDISPDFDIKENVESVVIFDKPKSLFSNIDKIEGTTSDAYYLSKALYKVGGREDILFAYEVMEAWLTSAGIDNPLREVANDLLYKICRKYYEDNKQTSIKQFIDKVKNEWDSKFSYTLRESKKRSTPVLIEEDNIIEYNSEEDFYEFYILRFLVEAYFKQKAKAKGELIEGLNHDNISELRNIIKSYIERLWVDDEFLDEKARSYENIIRSQAISRLTTLYIYHNFRDMRPLIIGSYLNTLTKSIQFAKRLLEKDNNPMDLVIPRRVSMLTESYLMQQTFAVVTMWDFKPTEDECAMMQSDYDHLVNSASNHFGNMYKYLSETIEIYKLSKYFTLDIMEKPQIFTKTITASNPVNKELIQGHGDHWEILMPVKEFIKNLSSIIQNSKPVAKITTQVSFDENEDVTADVFALLYGTGNIRIASILGYDKKENVNQFITAYPIFYDGRDYIMNIDKVQEWNNHVEAIVSGHIGEFGLSFFATDYLDHKDVYQPGNTLSIRISALAMRAEPAMKSFEFEGQQAIDFLSKICQDPQYTDDGLLEPVRFDTSKLVAFLPTNDRCPDEVQFQSPILDIKEEKIFDNTLYRADIIIHKDEADNRDIEIPVRFAKRKTDFEVGDPIQGWMWMLGEISPSPYGENL